LLGVIHLDGLLICSLMIHLICFCIIEITVCCSFTDFTREAKNSERTASCFRKNSVVKVPYVVWVWASWKLWSWGWSSILKIRRINRLWLNQVFKSQIVNFICFTVLYCATHTPTTYARTTHGQQEHKLVLNDCSVVSLLFFSNMQESWISVH